MLTALATRVITGWMSAPVYEIVQKAALGVGGIGPGVYDSLDARMVKAPANIMVAYEQASYFVAIGVLRALKNDEKGAVTALQNALGRIQAEGAATNEEVNWICEMTGMLCPAGGSGAVLQTAINDIERSGLNSDDSLTLTAILKANKFGFQMKQAVPVIVAIGAGALIGTLIYRWRRG